MKRNAKLPEVRKQELIAAAFKLFSERGYEKTSVRDILNEVGGEVGMFYHYFKSKDEIFELAIKYFLKQYVADCAAISDNDSRSFQQSLDSLIALQSKTIALYRDIWAEKIHWSMLSAIYKKTLESLIPLVEALLNKAVQSNEVSLIDQDVNTHETTLFLVYGISGVLHEKPLAELTQQELLKKQEDIRSLIKQFFRLKG